MSTRLELLKRYLEEDPSDSFIRYAIALEYISTKELVLAFDHLKKLLNDDPEYLAAYYQAGQVAERLNSKIEAMHFYNSGKEVARKQNDVKTFSEINAAIDLMNDE